MGKPTSENNSGLMLNRLAIILKEEQWNNKKLAEQLGYDATTVSLWVNNHVQPPVATFARIALIMNRNLQDYFVNTLSLDKTKKDLYLKELSVMAIRSKRTGKTRIKTKKSRKS